MPVDVNRAGLRPPHRQQRRRLRPAAALLPVGMDNGAIDLRGVRRTPAARAADNRPAAFRPRVQSCGSTCTSPPMPPPATTPARASCSRVTQKRPLATLPLNLTVYDFSLPDDRDLQMVGRLSWESLARLYPDAFENVTPGLLSRNQPKYASAVRTLDQLMATAERHRLGLFVPRLQPTVKWPVRDNGEVEPAVQWDDYDQLVGPLAERRRVRRRGSRRVLAAADARLPPAVRPGVAARVVVGGIPPLRAERLARPHVRLDRRPRCRPRQARRGGGNVVAHGPAPAPEQEAARRRAVGGRPAPAHRGDGPEMIDLANAGRLWAAAPGLVFSKPTQLWPDKAGQPRHWLRTDLAGLVPYAGAGGDQRDLRLWAWLAFLRNASLIAFGDALPSAEKPDEPAESRRNGLVLPGPLVRGRRARPDRSAQVAPARRAGLPVPPPGVGPRREDQRAGHGAAGDQAGGTPARPKPRPRLRPDVRHERHEGVGRGAQVARADDPPAAQGGSRPTPPSSRPFTSTRCDGPSRRNGRC